MRWPPPEDWPLRSHARQVLSKPHRWHVVEMGTGPTLLLLHGAGGSIHSFRDLIPILAQTHHVVALDLPGQGLTQLGARHRCGLDPMAEDIAALTVQEGWQPDALIGHSAGGAIALRLAPQMPSVRQVVGINPALGHFQGIAGILFPALAKLLALTPGIATVFSRTARAPGRVRGLIEGTGSQITDEGIDLYRRLVSDREHVDATLLMMAQWSLDRMIAEFPTLATPALLLIGALDKAVPPDVPAQAARAMPAAQTHILPQLGHLAHEEDPALIAKHIRHVLSR